MNFTSDTVKRVLIWAEAVLLGALLLKMFGVQLVQSWGAWWLLQIIVMLVAGGYFVEKNKAELLKHLEDLKRGR